MFVPQYVRRVLAALILIISISTSVSAADYFWVGGAGNWSDISHWEQRLVEELPMLRPQPPTMMFTLM